MTPETMNGSDDIIRRCTARRIRMIEALEKISSDPFLDPEANAKLASDALDTERHRLKLFQQNSPGMVPILDENSLISEILRVSRTLVTGKPLNQSDVKCVLNCLEILGVDSNDIVSAFK